MQRDYIQVIIQVLLWWGILKKKQPVYKGAARSPVVLSTNGENLCYSTNSAKGHNSKSRPAAIPSPIGSSPFGKALGDYTPTMHILGNITLKKNMLLKKMLA